MDNKLSREEVLELAKQNGLNHVSADLMRQYGTYVGFSLIDLTKIVNAALLSQQVEAAQWVSDERIVQAVRDAKVLCVHPEAQTTIDIARAVLPLAGQPSAVPHGEPVAYWYETFLGWQFCNTKRGRPNAKNVIPLYAAPVAAPVVPDVIDRLRVMHGLLQWNRKHTNGPIRITCEYAVANAVMDMIAAAPVAQAVPDTAQPKAPALRPYEFMADGVSCEWYLKRDVDAYLAAHPAAQPKEAGQARELPDHKDGWRHCIVLGEIRKQCVIAGEPCNCVYPTAAPNRSKAKYFAAQAAPAVPDTDRKERNNG